MREGLIVTVGARDVQALIEGDRALVRVRLGSRFAHEAVLESWSKIEWSQPGETPYHERLALDHLKDQGWVLGGTALSKVPPLTCPLIQDVLSRCHLGHVESVVVLGTSRRPDQADPSLQRVIRSEPVAAAPAVALWVARALGLEFQPQPDTAPAAGLVVHWNVAQGSENLTVSVGRGHEAPHPDLVRRVDMAILGLLRALQGAGRALVADTGGFHELKTLVRASAAWRFAGRVRFVRVAESRGSSSPTVEVEEGYHVPPDREMEERSRAWTLIQAGSWEAANALADWRGTKRWSRYEGHWRTALAVLAAWISGRRDTALDQLARLTRSDLHESLSELLHADSGRPDLLRLALRAELPLWTGSRTLEAAVAMATFVETAARRLLFAVPELPRSVSSWFRGDPLDLRRLEDDARGLGHDEEAALIGLLQSFRKDDGTLPAVVGTRPEQRLVDLSRWAVARSPEFAPLTSLVRTYRAGSPSLATCRNRILHEGESPELTRDAEQALKTLTNPTARRPGDYFVAMPAVRGTLEAAGVGDPDGVIRRAVASCKRAIDTLSLVPLRTEVHS